MSVSTLLINSLKSICVIVLLAGSGVGLTRLGYVTATQRKAFAEAAMRVALPCLLFTKVLYCPQCNSGVEQVDNCPSNCPPCTNIMDVMRGSWYLLVHPIIVVAIGLCLAKLIVLLTRCPKNVQPCCLAAVAFGNSTGLPLVLLDVVGPSLINSGILTVSPLVYHPVYLLLYPVLQWGVGAYFFQEPAEEPAEDQDQQPEENADSEFPAEPLECPDSHTTFIVQTLRADTQPKPSKTNSSSITDTGRDTDIKADCIETNDHGVAELPGPRTSTLSRISSGIVMQHMATVGQRVNHVASLTSMHDMISDIDEDAEVHKFHMLSKFGKLLAMARQFFAMVLVPPVVGSLLGIFVSLIPPLHGLFVDVDEQRDQAPLGFVFDALSRLGQAAVPLNLIVLGSNLSAGGDFKAMPPFTLVCVVLAKMVMAPVLVTLSVFVLSHAFGKTAGITPEAWFVAMVVSCTPTANNVMVMVELNGGKDAKAAMSTTILCQYLCAPALLTLSLTVFPLLLSATWFLPS